MTHMTHLMTAMYGRLLSLGIWSHSGLKSRKMGAMYLGLSSQSVWCQIMMFLQVYLPIILNHREHRRSTGIVSLTLMDFLGCVRAGGPQAANPDARVNRSRPKMSSCTILFRHSYSIPQYSSRKQPPTRQHTKNKCYRMMYWQIVRMTAVKTTISSGLARVTKYDWILIRIDMKWCIYFYGFVSVCSNSWVLYMGRGFTPCPLAPFPYVNLSTTCAREKVRPNRLGK